MNRLTLMTGTALLLVGTLACGRKAAPEAPALPTAEVHAIPAAGTDAGTGLPMTLTATRRATLATRLAASVRQVHVLEGARVGQGQLLVSLADEDLQGGLRAAQAAVAAAEAQHRRITALMAQKAAIPAEMDQATTGLAQAQAALAQVKANLAYTQIRAPFAGVVQVRRVNDGDFVGPGMPLLELEGAGELELTGTASEAEARHLKVGQKLTFEAEGRQGHAVITALAPGGDPVTHRAALRARVLGRDTWRTGTFARLRVPGGGTAGELTVPGSALVRRGELAGVFLARDGKAQLRWLSLGEARGDRFLVRAGLEKADVVIDRPGALRDGQPVVLR